MKHSGKTFRKLTAEEQLVVQDFENKIEQEKAELLERQAEYAHRAPRIFHGLEIGYLTMFNKRVLLSINSPLFLKMTPGVDDVYKCILALHPHQPQGAFAWWIWKKRIARKLYKLNMQKFMELVLFLQDTVQQPILDFPVRNSTSNSATGAVAVSAEAAIVDVIASHYGWTIDDVEAIPYGMLGQLFQLHYYRSTNGKFKYSNKSINALIERKLDYVKEKQNSI